ncbi:hypothetical protein ACSYAD_33050, partial [Acaryochloris marina NIES-2412]|uniref:hypothetical protein n=1 Tax=Acaryochloris marina TaxID=155978 RepID=UPI00405993DB
SEFTPAGGVGVNMVLAAISAYLLVHYVPYYFLEIEGERVKDFLSFWTYLDLDIRHTSLSFRSDVSTGELGSIFGYIYAFIQLIGFSIGGFAVFSILLDSPFCEKCEKYLQKTKTQDRYTSEGELLSEKIKELIAKLNGRKYLESLEFHAGQMGEVQQLKHHLRTRITMHKCKSCDTNHLNFEASRIENNDWKNIEDVSMKIWINHRLR